MCVTYTSQNHSHALVLKPNPYNGAKQFKKKKIVEFTCKECKEEKVHPAPSFHCEMGCGRDLCEACALKELNEEEKVLQVKVADKHPHNLVLQYPASTEENPDAIICAVCEEEDSEVPLFLCNICNGDKSYGICVMCVAELQLTNNVELVKQSEALSCKDWPGSLGTDLQPWNGFSEQGGTKTDFTINFSLDEGILSGAGNEAGLGPFTMEGSYKNASSLTNINEAQLIWTKKYYKQAYTVTYTGNGEIDTDYGLSITGKWTLQGVSGTFKCWPASSQKLVKPNFNNNARLSTTTLGTAKAGTEALESKANTNVKKTISMKHVDLAVPQKPIISNVFSGLNSASIYCSSLANPPVTSWSAICIETQTSYDSTSLPLIMKNLSGGESYSFIVSAVNSLGCSEFSDATASVTIRSEPLRPPPSPTVVIGNLPSANAAAISSTVTTTETTHSTTVVTTETIPDVFNIGGYIIFRPPIVSSGNSEIYTGKSEIRKEACKFKARILKDSKLNLEEAEREFAILSKLQNKKHIVTIAGEGIIPNNPYNRHWIVMEKGAENLNDFLLKKNDEEESDQWDPKSCTLRAENILQNIQWIHSHDLVWCDCKPSNIVTFGRRLKCVDFDSVVEEGKPVRSYTKEYAMPPEMCKALISKQELKADKSYDIWSLGLILFRIWSQSSRAPFWHSVTMGDESSACEFWTSPNLEKKIQSALTAEIRNPQIQILLSKMLAINPNERPSIGECLAHSIFRDATGSTVGLANLIKQGNHNTLEAIHENESKVMKELDHHSGKIIKSMAEITLEDFPSCVMVLPTYTLPETKLEWIRRMVDIDTFFKNKLQLHLLCEFSVAMTHDNINNNKDIGLLEPYWHRCVDHKGFELQEPKEFVKKAAPIIKGTLSVLSVASRLARVMGINFVEEIQDIASKTNKFVEGITGSNNIPDGGYTSKDGSSIPTKLTGETLEYMRTVISNRDNPNQDKHVVGPLWRTCITGGDCIFGTNGKWYWLCGEHKHLIEKWNQGKIKDQNLLRAEGIQIVKDLEKDHSEFKVDSSTIVIDEDYKQKVKKEKVDEASKKKTTVTTTTIIVDTKKTVRTETKLINHALNTTEPHPKATVEIIPESIKPPEYTHNNLATELLEGKHNNSENHAGNNNNPATLISVAEKDEEKTSHATGHSNHNSKLSGESKSLGLCGCLYSSKVQPISLHNSKTSAPKHQKIH